MIVWLRGLKFSIRRSGNTYRCRILSQRENQGKPTISVKKNLSVFHFYRSPSLLGRFSKFWMFWTALIVYFLILILLCDNERLLCDNNRRSGITGLWIGENTEIIRVDTNYGFSTRQNCGPILMNLLVDSLKITFRIFALSYECSSMIVTD